MGNTKATKYYSEKDYGFEEFGKLWSKSNEPEAVRVGIVSFEKHDGDEDLSVADIAMFHEFGKGNNPERPFMRLTFIKNKNQIIKMARKLLLATVSDGMDKAVALGRLGQFLKDKMVKTIRDGVPPPNQRPNKTLIDTGQLINSIDWELDE